MSSFEWIAVAVVTVLSSARLTRLATYDSFPPATWLREAYAAWTDKNDQRRAWQLLAYCGYCASFWLTALVVLSGWYWNWPVAWWLINATLGGSYVAAIVMTHDGDDSEDA